MSPITTHVLDTSLGRPAKGIALLLEMKASTGAWKELARNVTNSDGRVSDLLSENHKFEKGSYRLTFETGSYFASQNVNSMFITIVISFEIKDPNQHYHIPLLLSPFGYSTYRGS